METQPENRFLLTVVIAVIVSALISGSIVYAVQSKNNSDTKKDLQSQVDSLKSEIIVAKATPTPTASPTAAPTTSPTAAPTTSPTAAPTSSPTANPLADWKTYTDTTVGFSLQYPSNSTTKVEKGHTTTTFNTTEADDYFFVQIENRPFAKDKIIGLYGAIDQTKLTDVSMAGKTGYKYTDGDAGCVTTKYVVGNQDNSKTIEVGFVKCEGEKAVVTPLQAEIISSFKFSK